MSLKFTVIKLLCFSFLQQIFSFKKFDVADLGIFFGQAFYSSDKHFVIFTEEGCGMISKLVLSIDILQLSFTVSSIKHK